MPPICKVGLGEIFLMACNLPPSSNYRTNIFLSTSILTGARFYQPVLWVTPERWSSSTMASSTWCRLHDRDRRRTSLSWMTRLLSAIRIVWRMAVCWCPTMGVVILRIWRSRWIGRLLERSIFVEHRVAINNNMLWLCTVIAAICFILYWRSRWTGRLLKRHIFVDIAQGSYQ